MDKYIVTFGFNEDSGYEVVKSKPILAENANEAGILLKDSFEMNEGIECSVISVTKI